MSFDVVLASIDEVKPWRELHRHEMHCQIIHDSWLGRGWVEPYLMRIDGNTVGYSLVGGVRADPIDTVIEYYLLPSQRGAALPLFRQLLKLSKARQIEVQTNDHLLTLMLYDCAGEIKREAVLFEDAVTTHLKSKGTFRKADPEADSIFSHKVEPVGDWVIEIDKTIVATGGILFHYNPPYGDIYMEVAEPHRRQGYGSFLVQELKRTCYEMGKIPAARCNATNAASRSTLQRAGMLPCARMLVGAVATGVQ